MICCICENNSGILCPDCGECYCQDCYDEHLPYCDGSEGFD